MIIIAIGNNKGGVAKTKTAKLLSIQFAARGIPTQLIDLDPQANLTACFMDGEPVPSIADVLDGRATYCEAIYPTEYDNLTIVPASPALDDTDSRMVIDQFGILRLCNILEQHKGEGVILLDLPPNLGSLTTAALIAAHYVLIPVQPEKSAIAGVERITRKIGEIYNALSKAPRVLGTVATFVEDVTQHREGLEALQRPGMPPLLGSVPKRKGQNAESELLAAYDVVAQSVLAKLEVL